MRPVRFQTMPRDIVQCGWVGRGRTGGDGTRRRSDQSCTNPIQREDGQRGRLGVSNSRFGRAVRPFNVMAGLVPAIVRP